MTMQVTSPTNQSYSVSDSNIVYDANNAEIGRVDPATGTYCGHDGTSISLADLAKQGFVFSEDYAAWLGKSSFQTAANTSAGSGSLPDGVVGTGLPLTAPGDMTAPAGTADTTRPPTVGPSGFTLGPAGTALKASAVELAQQLTGGYVVPANPQLAQSTAAALFQWAEAYRGSAAETTALEHWVAVGQQLLSASKPVAEGNALLQVSSPLPYNPANGAIYLPVANLTDLEASTAYKFASAADQASMRAFVETALSDPTAANQRTDRWFDLVVSRPQTAAGPSAEQLAEAEWLERIKRETPDPFDTGTAWVAVYLERHPFDMEKTKRECYDELIRAANEEYTRDLTAWQRDQVLNAGFYQDHPNQWPKPTPPVINEEQLWGRAQLMAEERKRMRDEGIASFYMQEGQKHAEVRRTQWQEAEDSWKGLLTTEVSRVHNEMTARGFSEVQIAPYLDMVRQQFYANPFDGNGNHPTVFAWIPPEYYAAMLARGNA